MGVLLWFCGFVWFRDDESFSSSGSNGIWSVLPGRDKAVTACRDWLFSVLPYSDYEAADAREVVCIVGIVLDVLGFASVVDFVR